MSSASSRLSGSRPYALMAVICILGLAIVFGARLLVEKRTEVILRDSAIAEMMQEAGLKETDPVFADAATRADAGKNVFDITDIFQKATMRTSRAFILSASVFDGYVKKFKDTKTQDGKTWHKVMGQELSRKVLRGAIFAEPGNDAYFLLMQTNVGNPILITYIDKAGEKRQFRGSYNDMVPLRPELTPRWYLLMSPPSVPANFDWLKKEEYLTVHGARTGDFMASAALVEVHNAISMKEADPRIILVPLLEGWRPR
jgi:hypothetical protein